MFFPPAPSSTFCHCSSISWRTSAPRWGSISSRTWIASTRSLGSSSSPRWIHQHLENFNELAGHRQLLSSRHTCNEQLLFIFSPFCQRSWSWPKTPNGECDSLSLNTCHCLQVCYRFWPNEILCFLTARDHFIQANLEWSSSMRNWAPSVWPGWSTMFMPSARRPPTI